MVGIFNDAHGVRFLFGPESSRSLALLTYILNYLFKSVMVRGIQIFFFFKGVDFRSY